MGKWVTTQSVSIGTIPASTRLIMESGLTSPLMDDSDNQTDQLRSPDQSSS